VLTRQFNSASIHRRREPAPQGRGLSRSSHAKGLRHPGCAYVGPNCHANLIGWLAPGFAGSSPNMPSSRAVWLLPSVEEPTGRRLAREKTERAERVCRRVESRRREARRNRSPRCLRAAPPRSSGPRNGTTGSHVSRPTSDRAGHGCHTLHCNCREDFPKSNANETSR
jgi:hypothetical protein